MPTPSEQQEIQTVIRCFLWGKSTDGTCRGGKVSWQKVTEAKAVGGLGLVDPMRKARVFQGLWVLKTLLPGNEPWKPLFKF